jgi:hypothetical protein
VITGQSEADLLVTLSEVDAAMALEAGFSCPSPATKKVVLGAPRQADRIGRDGLSR